MDLSIDNKSLCVEIVNKGWVVRVSGNVEGNFMHETHVFTAREFLMDYLEENV